MMVILAVVVAVVVVVVFKERIPLKFGSTYNILMLLLLKDRKLYFYVIYFFKDIATQVYCDHISKFPSKKDNNHHLFSSFG